METCMETLTPKQDYTTLATHFIMKCVLLMDGGKKGPLDIGEDISFQDIFSENYESLIYEDINENEEVGGDEDILDGNERNDSPTAHFEDPSQEGSIQSEMAEETSCLDEEDPDAIPESLPPSYNNASFLNERYLLKLQDFLESLIAALQANQRRQAILDEEIQEMKGQKLLGKRGDCPNRASSSVKQRSIVVFCAPYFKDAQMFSHPDNTDTTTMKAQKDLSVYTIQPPKWLNSDKTKLKNAILSDAVHKRIVDSLDERANIIDQKQSNLAASLAQRKAWEDRLKIIAEKIKEVKSLPEDELLGNPAEEFDWLKISVQTFKGSFNHKCIQYMWRNLLHPSINKSSWSKEEDTRLRELVSQHKGRDWESIASKLNRNRPPYLCFVRYQRKFKLKESFKHKWTKEEDLRLSALVNQCRINSYIPWSKVTYYMPSIRHKNSCFQRYKYTISPKIVQGYFKMEEDFIIILGVNVFGLEWRRIERFLKGRTNSQIASRYTKSLSTNLAPWTLKEDKLLLQTIKAKGTKNWREISDVVSSRTRDQCRMRFVTIFKHYRKDPKSFNLEKSIKYASNESSFVAKARQDATYRKLDDLLKNCMEAEEINLEEDEPLPSDFLLRVMTILSNKLHFDGSPDKSRTKHLKPPVSPKKPVKLNTRDLNLRSKYNDFFRRFVTSKGGRERVRYKEEELSRLSLMGTSVWKLLQCEEGILKQENIHEQSEKYQQLFSIFVKCPREFPNKTNDESSSSSSNAPSFRPLVKTYSRKKKNIPSGTTPSLQLAPPSGGTCAAMKNMLSFLIDFHSRSKGPWQRDTKKALQKSETDGIFAEKFGDMYMHMGLSKKSEGEGDDALLMKRFKSVFFWPAVLSTLRSDRFESSKEDEELSPPAKKMRFLDV